MASAKSHPRILITGAAGRVGRVLSPAMVGEYSLTLLDIVPILPLPGAQVIQANLDDETLLKDLCETHDMVIHLAISGNMLDDMDAQVGVNLHATRKLFQIASETRCQRIVFSSTCNIDLEPTLPYSASKKWAEMLAAQYTEAGNLSVLCLRLGMVLPVRWYYWPDQSHLGRVLTHPDMIALFKAAVNASPRVKYGVYHGISANARPDFDISPARQDLGYNPQDDAFALAEKAYHSPRGLLKRMKRGILKYVGIG